MTEEKMRPDEKLHVAITGTVSDAVRKLIDETYDWDFIDGILNPILTYINECATADGERPISAWSRGYGEVEISCTIFEPVNLEALLEIGPINLSDLLIDNFDDCERSTRGMIYAAEKSTKIAREKYKDKFGRLPEDAPADDDPSWVKT